MKFTRLSECKGAERFGTCAECGKSSKDDNEMIKISWNGNTSTILCMECWIKARYAVGVWRYSDGNRC